MKWSPNLVDQVTTSSGPDTLTFQTRLDARLEINHLFLVLGSWNRSSRQIKSKCGLNMSRWLDGSVSWQPKPEHTGGSLMLVKTKLIWVPNCFKELRKITPEGTTASLEVENLQLRNTGFRTLRFSLITAAIEGQIRKVRHSFSFKQQWPKIQWKRFPGTFCRRNDSCFQPITDVSAFENQMHDTVFFGRNPISTSSSKRPNHYDRRYWRKMKKVPVLYRSPFSSVHTFAAITSDRIPPAPSFLVSSAQWPGFRCEGENEFQKRLEIRKPTFECWF